MASCTPPQQEVLLVLHQHQHHSPLHEVLLVLRIHEHQHHLSRHFCYPSPSPFVRFLMSFDQGLPENRTGLKFTGDPVMDNQNTMS